MTSSPDENHPASPAWPSPDGLSRLAGALGGGRCEVVEELVGGVSAVTHRCRHIGDHRSVEFALKQMPLVHAHVVAREFDRLQIASRTKLPTPDPLAVDIQGAWFGTAALAMSHVPGVTNLHPVVLETYAHSLATTLLAIHATTLDEAEAARLGGRKLWRGWQPHGDAVQPYIDDVKRALERLEQRAPSQEQVFCHADFFPGNLLWDGDHVVGVIDWSRALLAPKEADLANCRAALTIHPGGRAAQLFSDFYAEESTRPVDADGLLLWDVLYRAVSLQWSPVGIRALQDAGVNMSVDEAVDRARESLEEAIASVA